MKFKRKIRERFKAVICIALSAMVVITTPDFLSYADSKEEQGKLDKMMTSMGEAERILAELEANKADTEKFIEKLDKKLSDISLEIYKLEKKLKKVKKKIKLNEEKLEQQKKDIASQYDSMKLRIQFMYENGNNQIVDMLLGSKDISDFLNKVEYVSELSSYDRRMLTKMQKTQEAIEETKKTLEDKKTELVALKEKQDKKKETTEELLEAKKTELSAYDARIASSNASIKSMQSDISSQMEVVNTLKQAEARAAAEEASKKNKKKVNNSSDDGDVTDSSVVDSQSTSSGWMWPLPGYTEITSPFGTRTDPIDGTTSYHCGIDIRAPGGTPIHAVADGTIAWASSGQSTGNWTGIYHGNGLYSVYMHQSVMLVSPGQTVHKGDVIGLVGSTGRSTGNHLHLSVRLNGAYVAPLNYVSP
ncbi:murein hydrolase activator EnvC [Eubacterium uniforme]|uniref:Murein DD-endopeptidase MepM and murein hydrolase activator NlpD, contain LysM domain n=1 Tax=Eubacterium uniforme TaxID=39495 RepID=A0A1T4VVV4_9FIRM|nr:peptidoglycan DD-metalloendopeptidase family protein [Eubacterium uniforme]SKA69144.1 Murein DD-endopeptidase MepM and murein hydrolase activator NlpD, contain LysM domain [Eubacterium uniforme]HAH18002.1 peptidase M23 [Eubacterium sp.]